MKNKLFYGYVKYLQAKGTVEESVKGRVQRFSEQTSEGGFELIQAIVLLVVACILGAVFMKVTDEGKELGNKALAYLKDLGGKF